MTEDPSLTRNTVAEQKELAERKYKVVDPLMKHNRLLLLLVIFVSIAMAHFVYRIQPDRTLKSAYVTSSPAYHQYEDFLEVFGDDEFVLIAIRYDKGIEDPTFLKAIESISSKLENLPQIAQVVSIANLKVFQERKGIFGNYPLMGKGAGQLQLPESNKLREFRKVIPIAHFLYSPDLKCTGIMARLKDEWRFHPETGDLLRSILNLAEKHVPQGSEVRMVGAPVLREAVQQLTKRTTIIFGCLCLLIIAVVSLYIFKSFQVSVITIIVVGASVYWVMGLMSLLKVPLNATTSLSFGLVVVISVATVIHIISHYYEASRHEEDQLAAVRKALALVVRPCLMCSLTTAVAFATIMVSKIPMVQQLGMIMSLGVLISFFLALALTTPFLMALRPVDLRAHERMSQDWVEKSFRKIGRIVFRHYKICAISGIAFCLLMFAGTPFIHKDTQLLRLFVTASNEVADIRYVENHLTQIRNLELTVELEPSAFKKPETWQKIRELESGILNVPEVAGVESLLPLLTYLHKQVTDSKPDPEEIYTKKGLVAQLLTLITFNKDGKKLLRRYLSENYDRIRIPVRSYSLEETPVNDTIEKIKSLAEKIMGKSAVILVTGEQAVFAAQASEVVKSQLYSLILALTGISALIMIQLRSWVLGLISLFPNIPPIAVILGLMGWFTIPLDNVTVFAVAIAIGLAVDDTIHYLTQLRRDIASSVPGEGRVKEILEQSYLTTAKTLISTSSILFFGFLALTLTPTQPAIYFGFLGAAAILVALWGDLMFMPSLILTFPVLKRLIENEAMRKAGKGEAPTIMKFKEQDRL